MKLLLIVFTLAAATCFAAPETEPGEAPAAEGERKPVLSEEIRNKSPNGKYALRITYDRALNDQMAGQNPRENDGIFSLTMENLAIVSLPDKRVMHDLTESIFDSGNNFEGLTLLWSADSKWCAFYYRFPRVGSTSVYHLVGQKFKLAHRPDDLGIPAEDEVRNEYIAPVRWVKPGVLELSVERIFADHDEGDDIAGFTASFDGKGKWKVLKKKRAR